MGRCTGRYYLDERRPLIAMRCYWDGSKGNDDSGAEWLTLAGFIASDGFWGDFQGKWEMMLRARYPIAPFIHMSDMVTYNDPFERVAGWTAIKIKDLVDDAIKLLNGMNKRAYCSFVCSVDVSAHGRLLTEGLDMPPDPIALLAKLCIDGAFSWYFKEHPQGIEVAYVFFDQNEPYISEFRRQWLKRSSSSKMVLQDPFWGLIANVTPMNMRNTPPIQAADMLAWARTRSLSSKEEYRDLDGRMNLIVTQDGTRIDEAKMRRLAKG
jgi:hypothetical protein